MVRTPRMDKKFFISFLLISFIYLFLRFSYPETVEFGYDQPRLAIRVIDFIENGKIFETQKFAEKSPWGNISWGPALFYFYTPFLFLSKNPLLISYLISLFNLLSIMIIIYIGSKYISQKAGLLAGLILATQPWWTIFSRMIYQPTPVITLVTISMFLFLYTLKKPNSLLYSLLIFSWIFLIEIYVHTFSFVLVSVLLLIIYLKKRFINKFLIIGIIISSILIIPFIINFSSSDYFPPKAQDIEDRFINNRDGPLVRVKKILPGFIKTFSGGSMEYQLGYSYFDFYNKYFSISFIESFIFCLTILVLLYNFLKLFITSTYKFIRLLFLSWALSPLFFLVFMPLPNIPPIPRYFLISFPAFAILYGLFFSEVYKYSKFVLVLLLIPFFWIYFFFSYSNFIKNYTYPQGHLSTYSDTQYLFLFKAMKKAQSDNFLKGRDFLIISNDEKLPKEISLDWASRYLWLYVFNNKIDKYNGVNSGYYLIDFSWQKEDKRFIKIGRFGPYSLYEFRDL